MRVAIGSLKNLSYKTCYIIWNYSVLYEIIVYYSYINLYNPKKTIIMDEVRNPFALGAGSQPPSLDFHLAPMREKI